MRGKSYFKYSTIVYTLSIYRHKTVDLTRMFFCFCLFVFCLFGQTPSSLYSQSRSIHTNPLLRSHGQAIQVKNLKRILEQKVSHLPYLVGRHYALILVMFSVIL